MAWFKTSRQPKAVRPKRRLGQPRVEVLEDRCVMSTLVGLTVHNELLTFDSAAPGTVITSSRVSGLRHGEDLLGIDVRPATGQVFGLGDTGRLYTLDPFTGVATLKARLTADPADTSDPFVRLRGHSFGFDFNPVVDRLRVTSDLDQNLRINADTGLTTTDGTLAYVAGDANVGRNPNVAGSAYQNPDNNPATGTTLRGIDTRLDVLVTQIPANDGTLTTVGSLGVHVGGQVGFDIDRDGTAYAALTPDRGHDRDSALYTIDLTTGAATRVGAIGGNSTVRGLAILLPAQPVYAVTTSNNLIGFNSARPDILTSKLAITGLPADEVIQGIDFRPATGVLYALGSSGRLYTLNTATARATPAAALTADPTDATDPFAAVIGTAFGFDFNPVVDRLRVTSNSDQNLRINPDTGLTFTDGALAYGSGDANFGQDPNVVASGYVNNFPGTTATTLRGIDSTLDNLVIQSPANAGTLTTVGALGVDTSDLTSFDLSGGGTAFAGLTLVGGTNTGFYTIDLATGAATLVGTIGATTTVGGETVRGIAVAPAVVQFVRTESFVREHRGPAVIGVIRTGDTSGSVTVQYAASAGTATAGDDFAAAVGSITFGAGETSRTFTVSIVDDDRREWAETVNLVLTTPTGGGGATLGRRSTAELVIVDDDGHRGHSWFDAFWAGFGEWDWSPNGWW